MSRIEDSPGYNDTSGFGKFIGSLGTGLLNSVVPGLGSAVGSLFGNWLGDATGTSSIKRQLNASKDLSAYTNELNFNTWQKQFSMQNDRQDFLYRTQAETQKNSIIDAGLNPAMLNGQLGSVAGVSSPVGGNSYGSFTGSAQNEILPMMQMALQKKQLDIQEKVADADVSLKNAEAGKLSEETKWIEPQVQSALNLNKSTIDLNSQSLELNGNYYQIALKDYLLRERLNESEINQAKQEINESLSREALNKIQGNHLSELLVAQIYSYYASGACSYAQAREAVSQVAVNSQMVENLQKQWHLTDAEIENVMSVTSKANWDAKTAEEIYNQEKKNTQRITADTDDWVNTPGFWRRAANVGKYVVGPVAGLAGGYLLGKGTSSSPSATVRTGRNTRTVTLNQ